MAWFTIEDVISVVNNLPFLKDPTVIDFEVKPFSNELLGYLGTHDLLCVNIQEGKNTKTLTFFLKSRKSRTSCFEDMVFYEESKFFGEVMNRLLKNYKSEPWAAKCYLIKDNFMVLEDLRAKGFKTTNNQLKFEELKSAIDCLARFHSASIILEEKSNKSLMEEYPGFFQEKVYINDKGWSWKWLLCGIEVVEFVAKDLGLDYTHVSRAYELMIKKCQPTKNGRNVLCHLDLWFNNLLFNETGSDCRLVDFQMISYASYALDLLQIMYLNLHVETRRNMERELIEFYVEVLDDTLKSHNYKGQPITLDKVLEEFEDKRIHGLVAAVQFLPVGLWDKTIIDEYSTPESYMHYKYTSRVKLVQKALKMDYNYRCRIEEIIRDLITYMESL